MRYKAKGIYKRLGIFEDTLMWECKEGDDLDIEEVTNLKVYKVINRSRDNILDSLMLNKEEYSRFKKGVI